MAIAHDRRTLMKVRSAILIAALLSVNTVPAFAQTADEPPSAPATEPAFAGDLFVEGVTLSVDGETVELAPTGTDVVAKITIRNGSEKDASDVKLSVADPGDGTKVLDGDVTLGTIAAGAAGSGTITFSVSSENCYESSGLGGTITSSIGESPTKFGFAVDCPGPRLYFESVRYDGGDGDQAPEPGERLKVFVTLRNQGRDAATDVRGALKVETIGVRVIDGDANWVTIAPKTAGVNQTPFVIEISEDAKTAQPCQPISSGAIIVEDGGSTDSDEPVSSDGETPTQVAPAPDQTSEPGSTGAGSSGSTGTGTTDDDGSTSSGTIEPDRGEPEPEASDLPAKGEPEPEPAPAEDPPAAFDAMLPVSASGRTFDASFGSGLVCAFTEIGTSGRDDTAAPAADANEEKAVGVKSANGGGLAVAGVLLALIAAAILRSRLSPSRPA